MADTSNLRTNFHLHLQARKGSQLDHLYSYLQKDDPNRKQVLCYRALHDYYLVEALMAQGLGDREDLQTIAKQCIASLTKQINIIATLAQLQAEEDSIRDNQSTTVDQEVSTQEEIPPHAISGEKIKLFSDEELDRFSNNN